MGEGGGKSEEEKNSELKSLNDFLKKEKSFSEIETTLKVSDTSEKPKSEFLFEKLFSFGAFSNFSHLSTLKFYKKKYFGISG